MAGRLISASALRVITAIRMPSSPPGSVFVTLDSLLTLPLEAHLPPVRCPLLVIEGEHDEYATSLQMEALRPLAPQTQLARLTDTGHTPHREQPEIVLDQIANFLSGFEQVPSQHT